MLLRFCNAACWGADGNESGSVGGSESWLAVVLMNSMAAWRTRSCSAAAMSANTDVASCEAADFLKLN